MKRRSFIVLFALVVLGLVFQNCGVPSLLVQSSNSPDPLIRVINHNLTAFDSCPSGNQVNLQLNPGFQYLCKDLSQRDLDYDLGPICEGGVSVTDFTVNSEWKNCEEVTLCGVLPSKTKLTDQGLQLLYKNPPWGCLGNIQVKEISSQMIDELLISTEPPPCPYCESKQIATCLTCPKAQDENPTQFPANNTPPNGTPPPVAAPTVNSSPMIIYDDRLNAINLSKVKELYPVPNGTTGTEILAPLEGEYYLINKERRDSSMSIFTLGDFPGLHSFHKFSYRSQNFKKINFNEGRWFLKVSGNSYFPALGSNFVTLTEGGDIVVTNSAYASRLFYKPSRKISSATSEVLDVLKFRYIKGEISEAYLPDQTVQNLSVPIELKPGPNLQDSTSSYGLLRFSTGGNIRRGTRVPILENNYTDKSLAHFYNIDPNNGVLYLKISSPAGLLFFNPGSSGIKLEGGQGTTDLILSGRQEQLTKLLNKENGITIELETSSSETLALNKIRIVMTRNILDFQQPDNLYYLFDYYLR